MAPCAVSHETQTRVGGQHRPNQLCYDPMPQFSLFCGAIGCVWNMGRFEFYIEVAGDDASFAQPANIGTGDEPIDFQMTYNIEATEGSGQTLTGLIVLVIVALVVVGGFKIVREGGRRF